MWYARFGRRTKVCGLEPSIEDLDRQTDSKIVCVIGMVLCFIDDDKGDL